MIATAYAAPSARMCSGEGCDRQAAVKGLCGLHYKRVLRHGEAGLKKRQYRGRKESHQMYGRWVGVCKEDPSAKQKWGDFWNFVDTVGPRPSSHHVLRRIDQKRPVAPDNFKWEIPVRVAFNCDDPNARRDYIKKLQSDDPEWRLKAHLSRYGMTADDYFDLMKKQNGVCAICEQEEIVIRNGKKQRLSVDHCHSTGKIRGLLCANCNKILGHAHDEVRKLTKAIAYLETHLEGKA